MRAVLYEEGDMVQNNVRAATFAFIKGRGTAAEVVAQLVEVPAPVVRPVTPADVEQAVLETSEDFVTPSTQQNSWGDVQVYWAAMTPAQREELLAARKAGYSGT